MFYFPSFEKKKKIYVPIHIRRKIHIFRRFKSLCAFIMQCPYDTVMIYQSYYSAFTVNFIFDHNITDSNVKKVDVEVYYLVDICFCGLFM